MKAIDKEALREVMLSKVPAKVHAVNNKAFDLGEKYANDAMSGKTYQASCNAEGCKME